MVASASLKSYGDRPGRSSSSVDPISIPAPNCPWPLLRGLCETPASNLAGCQRSGSLGLSLQMLQIARQYGLLCWLLLFLTAFMWPSMALAQARSGTVVNVGAPAHRNVTLSAGNSRLYRYNDPVIRVSVADPAIADVVMISPTEAYLLGKKPGVTNVFLWHDNQQTSVIDLTVQVNIADIRSVLSKLLPGESKLEVTAAGDSVVLSGQMSDPAKVAQAMQIAEQISGADKKVMNMMRTDFLPQVLLEVKIAEIDKQLADELGVQALGTDFAFSAAGASGIGAGANLLMQLGDVESFLRAQESDGLIKILAEPNIMAISGQEGNFLAGGTVFLPVPQSNATGGGGAVITLQEQNFGVSLKFTPTVLEGGRINLVVRPEVSEVSPQGVQVSAGTSQLLMPVIRSRAASTTVQLTDGQTFAIGGLISNSVTESITAFPWLSSIPILGALFRSSSFQARRTELVILVTPRLVKPMNKVPALPTDRFIQPTQAEFMLEGKLQGTPAPAQGTQGVSAGMASSGAGRSSAIRIVQDYGY